MPDQPELSPGWAPRARKRYKKPDYVFDGLRAALGIKQVSKIERGILNKAAESLVAKGLSRDDPKVLPLIQRRARRFLELQRCKSCGLTAINLVKFWDQCGDAPQTPTYGCSRRDQAEADARWACIQDAYRKWYVGLGKAGRKRLIDAARTPMASNDATLWHEWEQQGRPFFEEK